MERRTMFNWKVSIPKIQPISCSTRKEKKRIRATSKHFDSNEANIMIEQTESGALHILLLYSYHQGHFGTFWAHGRKKQHQKNRPCPCLGQAVFAGC